MNVTLVSSSGSVRPFLFASAETLLPQSTTSAQASLGKFKDSVYSTFQMFLTATANGASATIEIQGTMDALTGAGVTVPCVLTNGATTCTIPNQASQFDLTSYTMNILDGSGMPTQQRVIQSALPASWYALPYDKSYAILPTSGLFDTVPTGIISLQTGMYVIGANGLGSNTISAFVSPTSLTLASSFTGTSGIYNLTFLNNYWAATALGTVTLSAPSALVASDAFTVATNYKYVRANVTAIAGTNATVQVWMAA